MGLTLNDIKLFSVTKKCHDYYSSRCKGEEVNIGDTIIVFSIKGTIEGMEDEYCVTLMEIDQYGLEYIHASKILHGSGFRYLKAI